MPNPPAEPVFFATPEDFRAWLEAHHEGASELLVGYYKKGTGRPSITWPQSVDEALCVGWIDGVRRSLGEDAYTIRFTPRKASSNWSAVNVKRVAELTAEGRMRPAGIAAWERRREARTAVYSYEQEAPPGLSAEEEESFRARPGAWEFFQGCPPGYRRTATHWVTSAKRDDTRRKRLAQLVEDSAAGRRIAQLTRPGKPPKG